MRRQRSSPEYDGTGLWVTNIARIWKGATWKPPTPSWRWPVCDEQWRAIGAPGGEK